MADVRCAMRRSLSLSLSHSSNLLVGVGMAKRGTEGAGWLASFFHDRPIHGPKHVSIGMPKESLLDLDK